MCRLKGNRVFILGLLVVLLSMALYILGCTSEEEEEEDGLLELNLTTSSGWDRITIKQVMAQGLLSPHVKAIKDSNGQLHVAYFETAVPEEQIEEIAYEIKYNIWNLDTLEGGEEEIVILVDNCSGLGFALDSNNTPVVAYQGGALRLCGQSRQSDVMLSIASGNNNWSDYTGAIGIIDPERNPYFSDGLAGADVSVAFDPTGNIHIGYQFKYEGCDTSNFAYPELCYVGKTRTNLTNPAEEEVVQGNNYINFSTGIQSRAGDNNDILINNDNEPVFFYYAEIPPTQNGEENQTGLRVSYRQNGGGWTSEWIEEDAKVGDISCTIDPSGNLCVAYYVLEYQDTLGQLHTSCLKFARQLSNNEWQVQTVDETTLCGRYCSLAFDASGNPAMAYYSEMSRNGRSLKDLKLARFSGTTWDIQNVASRGDVGHHNTLLFSEDGRAQICTYSLTDKKIYLYFQLEDANN